MENQNNPAVFETYSSQTIASARTPQLVGESLEQITPLQRLIVLGNGAASCVAFRVPREVVVRLISASSSGLGFAWAFLFATRSLFDSWDFLQSRNISPLTIEGRIVLAMTLLLGASVHQSKGDKGGEWLTMVDMSG